MKKKQASNYVIKNARFMADASETPYFVRFPRFYSTTVFFSDDTYELVEMVFRFSLTKEGRELWDTLRDDEKKAYDDPSN